MSKIFALSKVLFLEQFKSGFAKISAKKKTKKVLLVLFLAALILFSIGMNYYNQYINLDLNQMGHYILFWGSINVIMVLLILFTLQIQNVFFQAKDFELLASLPLKNYEIILSKLLAQLLNAYIVSFLIFAPALVFFFLSFSATFVSVLFLVLGFIFLPFFNFFIATMISYLINFISQFFASPKKASTFLSYLFMMAIIIGISVLNVIVISKIVELGQIPNILNFVFPTATQYFYSVTLSGNFSFLIYLGLNLIFIFFTVLALSKTYFKVNKTKKSAKTKNNLKLSFKEKSVFKNLIKFEFKRFLSVPVYVFNAGLGSIFVLLITVAFPILYFVFIKGSELEILLYQRQFMMSAGLLLSVLSGINCTTYVSVSIEGKLFYFKKSLPISFEKQMLAKVFLNMLLVLPTLMLITVLLPFFIMAKLYFYEILLLYGVALAVQLFVALAGLISNLFFIKLDWSNPTLLIKQSVPAFLHAVLVMALISASVFLFPIVLRYISLPLLMFLVFVVLVFLISMLWILIVTHGKKKYEKTV